ncbi:MAG: ACP S-malonyltransferase, partial [Defluviitaleaceae bacterium]|nr:ACP S-malonyltransferase [Defluviitaleaceae bacterium]
ADTVALVRKRGQFMAEACLPGTSGMSAIMNLSRELALEACEQASAHGVVVAANFNMPGQIVIAGEIAALEAAEQLCKEKGARKCIRLGVAGAFHTPLLDSAAQRLAAELAGLDEHGKISAPKLPVVSNYTARPIDSAQSIAPTLLNQIVSPVLWEDSLMYLLDNGVDTFIEIGPGKALSGFIKKTAGTRPVSIYNIEDTASYNKVMEAIS